MLQNNKWFIVALIALTLASCIKKYDPGIPGSVARKFVVSGQITKGENVQRVNVSTTSPIDEPLYKSYVPVTGCRVKIVDDKGNSYDAVDVHNGNYESVIPEERLTPGTSYKVQILTPDGIQIASDFDQLYECPEVDSIYYMIEELPSVDPYSSIMGLQFYCNLEAKEYSCRNFRWEAIETWEYKAALATTPMYKICWDTEAVKDVFVLSTKNLTENNYTLFPLHFVDNYSSQRLSYGYSLFISQYSLSDAAYEYWDKIHKNYVEQGGLYTKQPLKLKGNMHNLSNPEEQVLGFFGATSIKTKRIYVENVAGLPIEYKHCEPDPDPMAKPPPYCFNCLLSGGTNIKPVFWPY